MSFKNAMQATQKSILQYAKQGQPYEVLAALLAARQFNTTITETDLQAEAGKKRQLKINYYPPVCSDAGTGNESICDPGIVVEPKQVFFEISRTTASAVYQLNRDDIRFVDGTYTFSDHAKAAINAALPAVRRKLATEAAALMVAGCLLEPGHRVRILPGPGIVVPVAGAQKQNSFLHGDGCIVGHVIYPGRCSAYFSIPAVFLHGHFLQYVFIRAYQPYCILGIFSGCGICLLLHARAYITGACISYHCGVCLPEKRTPPAGLAGENILLAVLAAHTNRWPYYQH